MNLPEDFLKQAEAFRADPVATATSEQMNNLAIDSLSEVFENDKMTEKQKVMYAFHCMRLCTAMIEHMVPPELMALFYQGQQAESLKRVKNKSKG